MKYYNNAQICLNGHIITQSYSTDDGENFCHNCGAETIRHCLKCNKEIRGSYNYGDDCCFGFMDGPPAYCYNCGEPFPWTEYALESARIVIDEEHELSTEDKEKLKKSLPDLISETPKTELAMLRFKKAISSVGAFTKDALVSFASSMACEAVKKHLGL